MYNNGAYSKLAVRRSGPFLDERRLRDPQISAAIRPEEASGARVVWSTRHLGVSAREQRDGKQSSVYLKTRH